MDIFSHFISNDIIRAIGWTLINITWQALLVALLVWFFLRIFKQASAQFKYSVALLSLTIIVALTAYNFNNSYQKSDQISNRVNIVFSSNENLVESIAHLINTSESSVSYKELFIDYVIQLEKHLPIIVNIWIIGIIFFMLKFFVGYFYLQKLKRDKVLNIGDKWIEKFNSIELKLAIKKRISYLESKVVKIPLVLGYLKPVIIIPAGMLTGIPENQIEAIIAHELAHIRRNDYLVNILQIFIEIVFFYHPAVWYISSVIRSERENCCDDLALTACDGSLTYAKALVSVQELNPGKVYSAVAFSGPKKQLLNRIKRMVMKTEMKSNVNDRIIATLIVSAGIIIATLTVGFTAKSTENTNVYKGDIIHSVESGSGIISDKTPDHKVIIATQRDTTLRKKGKADHIEIDSKTIIRDFTDKDGKKRNIKFSLENGNVTEMFIDGKEVAKKDYKVYQSVVDETIDDLKKAKVEIRKAMKEIQEIDVEKIKREVEVAMKKVHINMDSINSEIEKSLKVIKVVNVDSIMNDVQISLKNVERINFDSIMIEVQKSIKEVKEIDMEEVRRQMEEARHHIEEIDFEKIRKEIVINWSDISKDIDTEAIKKELEKVRNEMACIDWDNMRVEIDKDIISFDKDQIMKDMEKELQKLEELELDKK